MIVYIIICHEVLLVIMLAEAFLMPFEYNSIRSCLSCIAFDATECKYVWHISE